MSRMVAVRLIAALAVLIAVVATLVIAFRPLQLPAPTMLASRRPTGQVPVATLSDSSFRLAMRSAGFRANRIIPSAERGLLAAGTARPPDPPKPQLALVGLVLGKLRTALLTGVPGNAGTRLMSTGDTAGGIRVRSISANQVLVAGYDTTWILRSPEVTE